MLNSISQNFKNVLKNRIKILISSKLYNTVDFIVDNIFSNPTENQYLHLVYTLQASVRDLIRTIIISTFEEIDSHFKDCAERKSRYYVNKSNVSRTLTTIVGTISFSRTYFQNKFSNDKFFYIDKCFDLPKYDHYDPTVKAIAVDKAAHSSQAQSARDTAASISDLSYYTDYNVINNIPRQSVHNWIKEWYVPDIVPSSIDTPDTLYIMADEKYIGAQDIDKDIMVKSFVAFEDVKQISKGRRALTNRFVFSCYDSNAWPKFMDCIAKRYDFSKIKNICLLADGGSWIKTGIQELKLDPINKVKFYLCEFHFIQAIHHITIDEDERKYLKHIFKRKNKKYFESAINQILLHNPKRKQIITQKLNYILNNYSSIKSMLSLNIGSSMESHISHLIASFFSSRPKGFSTQRIEKYLKLNDYKNNNINIFKLYMQSYNNDETIKINESQVNGYSIFEQSKSSNIPILERGQITETYRTIYSLAH